MPRHGTAYVLAVIALMTTSAEAQWLKYPTPGIPRSVDGKVDLNAPAPRKADGKPDLTGVWQMRPAVGYVANIVSDLNPTEVMPWADAAFRQRLSDFGKDDPLTIGCLPRGPRAVIGSGPLGLLIKITQTPTLITILFEDLVYRQIFLDGRGLPQDPSPSFMGYSVGRWEGDTLVVESTGFNDRTWLDFGGHPHTEALRIVERFHRRTVGSLDLQVTFEDKGAYTRPWTVPVSVMLSPDTELLEYVCNENDSRRTALSSRTEDQKRIVVPADTLFKYAGRYVLEKPVPGIPFRSIDLRVVNGELLLDMDEKGSVPLMPLSSTRFAVRFIELEFWADERGIITAAEIIPAGVRVVRK